MFYDDHGGRVDNVVHSDRAKRRGTLDEDRAVIDFVCIPGSYAGTSVERELVCSRGERDLVEVVLGDGGMGGEDMSVPIEAFALRVLSRRIKEQGDSNTYQYLIITNMHQTTD